MSFIVALATVTLRGCRDGHELPRQKPAVLGKTVQGDPLERHIEKESVVIRNHTEWRTKNRPAVS